jgi:hypothetical protein
MAQPKNLEETTKLPGVALQQIAPAVRAIPAVLTSSGIANNLVLIKSTELDQQLRQFLSAGVRYVEIAVFIEGILLTFKASIVKRGAQLPLHLHPVGEASKFLAELYQRRRAASGRRRNSIPLLVLNVVPLLEKSDSGGRL